MEAIIIAIVEYVGAPFVLRLLATRIPADVAHSILDAEYRAIQLAADEAAKRIIG